MARKVLDNSKGKGAKTLGSKAGNVVGAFGGGKSTTKKAARIAVGKNSANAAEGKKRGKLSLSKKDGQRSGGNAALSNATKGPKGITSKKGRLK